MCGAMLTRRPRTSAGEYALRTRFGEVYIRPLHLHRVMVDANSDGAFLEYRGYRYRATVTLSLCGWHRKGSIVTLRYEPEPDGTVYVRKWDHDAPAQGTVDAITRELVRAANDWASVNWDSISEQTQAYVERERRTIRKLRETENERHREEIGRLREADERLVDMEVTLERMGVSL